MINVCIVFVSAGSDKVEVPSNYPRPTDCGASSARSSRKKAESRWSEGAYTFVTVKLILVTVEDSTVVSVCLRMMKLSKASALTSHAVRIPPQLPPASTQRKSRREGKRKERALAAEVEESFVSCRQTTVGLAVVSVSLTTSHLSVSPRPRTFQERS